MIMRRHTSIVLIFLSLTACSPRRQTVGDAAEPDYGQVEYLSDHLAVAVSDGTARLITADGEVIAAAEDASSLKADAEHLYARFLENEYSCWEELLDQYDSLCSACIAARPADELLPRLERIRTSLQHVVGRMDAQQRDRFERIRSNYERFRK